MVRPWCGHDAMVSAIKQSSLLVRKSHSQVYHHYDGLKYEESPREIMMGVGDGVASVIMLTFTSEPCPHADFYK